MTFTFFQCLSQDIGRKLHNLHTDSLVWAWTNDAPNVATWAAYADVTNELATANGYTRAAEAITGQSYTQAAGVAKLSGTNPTVTASGAVGPFRYQVLYNNTAAGKNLIGYIDRGASLSLVSGDTYTATIGAGGVFTDG